MEHILLEPEAIQFTRNNYDEVVSFTNGKIHEITIEKRIGGRCRCRLATSSGCHIINEYDYIVKAKNGEYYSCEPNIYKKVEEEIRRRYEEV